MCSWGFTFGLNDDPAKLFSTVRARVCCPPEPEGRRLRRWTLRERVRLAAENGLPELLCRNHLPCQLDLSVLALRSQ